jgi:hypothetical protein
MENKSDATMSNTSTPLNFISSLFGVTFFTIGAVNVFWGNDTGFGIFIILLSLLYFPPVNNLLVQKTGRSIPRIIKTLLGIFICWAALGVGELFDKVDMMMMDL